MKNLLLLILAVFILVALFGDGGLEISPTLSPELQAQLEFSPNLSYAPATTNVETQSNTYIDTNVEQQIIQVMPTPTRNGEPVGLYTLRATPAPSQMTRLEMQAAFLRNGGELPWLWDIYNEQEQIDWLVKQAETWK